MWSGGPTPTPPPPLPSRTCNTETSERVESGAAASEQERKEKLDSSKISTEFPPLLRDHEQPLSTEALQAHRDERRPQQAGGPPAAVWSPGSASPPSASPPSASPTSASPPSAPAAAQLCSCPGVVVQVHHLHRPCVLPGSEPFSEPTGQREEESDQEHRQGGGWLPHSEAAAAAPLGPAHG